MNIRGPIFLSLIACGATACSVAVPRGQLPAECSGVPGDFRTPNAMHEPGAATHGPETQGHPIELQAIARPPIPSGVIPLLYVYDEDGNYISSDTAASELLTNPVFAQVEREAYWGEIADNRYYRIPWLDKCSQAAMLGTSVSFRAPPKGIMFMQFVAPFCWECTRITGAINEFVAKNRDTPVRWIRVSVPWSIGSLQK
jgi:hypothetical protein